MQFRRAVELKSGLLSIFVLILAVYSSTLAGISTMLALTSVALLATSYLFEAAPSYSFTLMCILRVSKVLCGFQLENAVVATLELTTKQFKLDPTKKYFVMRAMFKVCARMITMSLAMLILTKTITHIRQFLLVKAFSTFATSQPAAVAAGVWMIAGWAVLGISNVISGYCKANVETIANHIQMLVSAKGLELYLAKDCSENFLTKMRAIKFYLWEHLFMQKDTFELDSESTPLAIRMLMGLIDIISSAVPEIAAALMLFASVHSNKQIAYTDVAILLSSVNSLISFTRSFAAVPSILKHVNSTEQAFKELLEVHNISYIERQPTCSTHTYAVTMDSCKFSWGYGKFELEPPSMAIKSGEFVVVVGPVGQGKSSLLSAICGEMPIVGGAGCVYGNIGYVSQSPWIMNASFKENVLFGNDYDDARYKQVIFACALTDDISELPAGDATEIGFKGVNLSGGQKARLALARAIYTDADIFILDDILSAVDIEVGRHIIEHVLTGNGMVSNKTRLLVTHAEYVVPLSDKVVVFSESGITVSDQASIDYQSLFKHKVVEAPRILNEQGDVNKGAHTLMPETDVSYPNSTLLLKFVEFSGYAVVVLGIIIQFASAYLLYYLERKRINLLTSVNSQYIETALLKQYLLYNAAIAMARTLVDLFSGWMQYNVWSKTALANMYQRLIKSLLFTKLAIFERLSRHVIEGLFDGEVLFVALLLPRNLVGTIKVVFTTGYSLLNMMETLASLLVLVIPLACLHMNSLTALMAVLAKELLTVSIFMWFKWRQYAYGLTVSSSEIHVTVDVALSALSQLANFSLSTPAIATDCQMLSKFMAYTECLEKEGEHFNDTKLPRNWPAQGKISVHGYSMRYHQELKPVLHNLTFDIKSREKVGVVGRTGAGKSSLSQALLRLVEPDSGSIEIDGVDISTIGLHDLRSQISIVPQDPVLFEGTVRENLDPDSKYSDDEIWQVLKKARIDHLMDRATGVYTAVTNIDSIADTKGAWVAGTGLSKWVEADGRNFSLGQRQLLCLCRALLWRRGILILDEATANVDSKTDELMQEIIRNEFADCTVITIAHRLNTIMNSDRIMVMDQGQIAEFDKPDVLLSQKNSRFSQLVRSTEFK
ncbi:Multidrug resistance-associated protein 1 [Coemansia sp. RSA 2336]|nr:Multidrug resistance-associated protein 1 [Coemansia sp. RSA 2336]